jgi:hypothetical protein
VAPAEAVHRAELASGQVKHPQPAAAQLLSPDDGVVALGAPALLFPGRLVGGHHGDQPAVRQRPGIADLAAPVRQALGLPATGPYPVHLNRSGAIREEKHRRRIRRPSRSEVIRHSRRQLPRQ